MSQSSQTNAHVKKHASASRLALAGLEPCASPFGAYPATSVGGILHALLTASTLVCGPLATSIKMDDLVSLVYRHSGASAHDPCPHAEEDQAMIREQVTQLVDCIEGCEVRDDAVHGLCLRVDAAHGDGQDGGGAVLQPTQLAF